MTGIQNQMLSGAFFKCLGIIIALVVIGFGNVPATYAATSDAVPIGQIKNLEGNAFIGRDKDRLQAILGADIFQNDELITTKNASLGVTFIDGTLISLGSESTLIMDEFAYEPQNNKTEFGAQFVLGTFTYLSGRIAKISPENVNLKTPTSTLGIRGTRLLIKVVEEE